MAAIGALAIWAGGLIFALLVALIVGAMVWEVFRMCGLFQGPAQILIAALHGALALSAYLAPGASIWVIVIAAALWALGFWLKKPGGRREGFAFIPVLIAVGIALIQFRNEIGASFLLWLILVVIASDVMGYFAGKSLGGAKFWPAISPKKTWSGTVAGWAGAALVGMIFQSVDGFPDHLILVSVMAAFAGQMGDIAESWLKRRVGVKDSSNLIPGHGGVLDRFDALSGATIFVLALSLIAPSFY